MCTSHFQFCTKQFHALCLMLLASSRLQRPQTHDAASASCIESMHFKGVSIIPVCICNVLVLVFSGKVRCKNAFYKSKIFSQGFKNNKEKCVTRISISATHIQRSRGLANFVLANRAPSHFAELGTWWESNSASFFQRSGKKNCIHVGTDFSALNVPNLLTTFFSFPCRIVCDD